MYNGKVIYNPSGKAGEYSYWAANFYNGCSARCEYCYNRKGVVAKVLGGDIPTLKKSLGTIEQAFHFFKIEVEKNLEELRRNGLFFNFVSDPFLDETRELNTWCMRYAMELGIKVKSLTKQTKWVGYFLMFSENIDKRIDVKNLFHIGFTLTGHDSLEPGAATNLERIEAATKLKAAGFKVWFSIEPIIDIESSWKCIIQTSHISDLYKIGLQSGKKYDKHDIKVFMDNVIRITKNEFRSVPVYFKDSLLKQAGISRESLPSNCVDRTFNL